MSDEKKNIVVKEEKLQEKLQNKMVLEKAFLEFDRIVLKGYLDNLNEYEIIPLETSIEDAVDFIRLKKITRIVYDKEEDNLDKFNNVFSALHSCDTSLVIILKGSDKFTDIYLGTNKPVSNDYGYSAEKTLEASLKGSFPGIEAEDILDDEIEKLLESVKTGDNNFIANITGVPSLKNDDKQNQFIQGLEKIIEGMKNKNYTAVIQGSPVTRNELEVMEGAYQDIYSALSVFEQNQLTLSENESIALGISMAKTLTKTITDTVGKTLTKTKGKSTSESSTTSVTPNFLKRAWVGIFGGKSSTSSTKNQVENSSTAIGISLNKALSEATGETVSDSETLTNGTSKSLQITEKNRKVQSVLENIDEQLKRIQECKNYGMWSWGAYFISEDEVDSKLGADLYSGILRGEQTGLERSNITVWDNDINNKSKFDEILNYISQLKHPVFKTPEYFNTTKVSATSLISTKEVSIAMSLPQKSLPGIPVFESVEFGRAVTTYRTEQSKKKICIGSIFNMGSVDENLDVDLDIDSLTSHTFITGSTGSGKSNSIYSILHSLWEDKKIPFLIIEPAKGEYKNVIGGYSGVNVFGTNPYFTPLFKINPFSFPKEIHVIEHIDRLIEILNAVWPMYAAMPAILKEAIELTYEKMGWDLLASQNKYGLIFPDFQDLLEVLPSVIENSQYSQEIKSNYAGALLTRVRSMTNGYFKTIFQKEELLSSELFDKPCIVDLSRVGSSETKSLLMGIVFLKLQEYRMSKTTEANTELKHITVLEEAHNLLRKTSSEQSQEGANLQGKSVEMISNAIAEMRTYGEGFIIADQAPGLLDPSVIRNTNTKIILRLPDWEDRNLVGRAANLKDEQIEELARLRTGCAAVYQNDWQKAVLCQFDMFDSDKAKKFNYNAPTQIEPDSRKRYKTELLKILLECRITQIEPAELIEGKNIDFKKYAFYYPKIIKAFQEGKIKDNRWVSYYISELLEFESLLDYIPKTDNFSDWTSSLLREIFKNVADDSFSNLLQLELIKVVFNILSHNKPEQIELWNEQVGKTEYWRNIL